MSLSVRKFSTLLVLSLAIAGCQTHDRAMYQHPLPWKTRPVPVKQESVLPDAETPPPDAGGEPVLTPAPAAPMLDLPAAG